MARPANESSLPFPPFGSFVSFLDDLGAMGMLPNRLNQQVFASSYSGSARQQTLKAFRFFDLTDDEGSPKEDHLRPLLSADTRKAAMAALLKERYKSLIDLPLKTAGPAEVNGWFANIGMDAATTRKAKSFFLTAAKENGIDVHPLVATRGARGAPRGKRKGVKKSENSQTTAPLTPAANSGQTGILFHPALDAFLREARKLTEGDNWSQEARNHVVAGFTTQLDLFLPVKDKK